ncbi:retrovirus-related pol polyprotein from transposon TNT 1-94 [Tanacetum coccineum]
MWNDLILAHEGPTDTRDTKIAALSLKFNAFKSLEGEKVMGTFTRLKCLLNDLENNGVTIPQAEVNATFVNSLPRKWLSMNQTQRANNFIKNDSLATLDSKYNYKEGLIDQIYEIVTQMLKRIRGPSNEFMADLNAEIDDLTKGKSEKGKRDKGKSEKGLIVESFDWDEESVSLEDEGTTRIRAFMAIAEDERSVRKADARSGQWVDITMKKRKNMVNKYNLLKQKLSLHKSELSNLKNIVFINCSLQNEVIRVNLENESLKDEISDLKMVIEKWTMYKSHLVTALLKEIPGNIVKDLRGKGRIKENNLSKKVLFTKADISTSESAPMITSDSEDDSDIKEPLPPLPKLTEADPAGASKSLISLSDLTANMADLTLNTASKEIKKSFNKQLLLTLMEEVKGIKKQILIPSDTSSSVSQACSSKTPKQKVFYLWLNLPHYQEHTEQTAVRKSLNILKGQSLSKSTLFRTARRCEIYRSIAHEIADCLKNLRNNRKQRVAIKQSEPIENGCSRHITGVKQYLHIYSKEPGLKVGFGDDSSRDTEGYGLVNCNGIIFTRVAYVNSLKHNLIRISQLCDANFKVLFTKTQGTIFNKNDKVVLIAPRRRDVYVIDMSSFNKDSNACFLAKASPRVNWLWHKILSHLKFKNINNLAKHNLVFGLPSLTFSKDKKCLACKKGKHHTASFKTKRSFSINKSLHLLYMDLFGPVKPQTISHNKYTLVIVDEYSRKMENLNEVKVKELRSDNRTEFKNYKLEEFCDEKAARTMLNSANLPKQFWREAVNTACYTQNRSIIEKRHRKTAYDIFRGRSPDISYFYVFGCPVHIHNHKDHLGKFNEKADDGFFLGYSPVAKAFRVFNIRRQEMEETYHVTFSEDDEAISQISTEGDAINFNEIRSFPDDEF